MWLFLSGILKGGTLTPGTLCTLCDATGLSRDYRADFGRLLTKKVMSHSHDGPGVTAPLQTNIVPLTGVWNPPSVPPPLKSPRFWGLCGRFRRKVPGQLRENCRNFFLNRKMLQVLGIILVLFLPASGYFRTPTQKTPICSHYFRSQFWCPFTLPLPTRKVMDFLLNLSFHAPQTEMRTLDKN